MILNNKQQQELLKLFENNEVNLSADLDIEPLDLMGEVERALLNEASDNLNNDDAKEELVYSIRDHLINYLNSEHFIYYMDAMDYLREEDSSLRQSFEIAKEYGLQDICSITLANLLSNQKHTTKP